jgi:hypothetical protein
MPLAGTPQAAKEINHIIAGHAVENVKAFFAGGDQTRASSSSNSSLCA